MQETKEELANNLNRALLNSFKKFIADYNAANPNDKNYANSYYKRYLNTIDGRIELKVPRDRKSLFNKYHNVFQKYLRQCSKVIQMIMFLTKLNFSQTSIIKFLKWDLGIIISPQKINFFKDKLINKFHEIYSNRTLPEKLDVVKVDATYVKISYYNNNKISKYSGYINDKTNEIFRRLNLKEVAVLTAYGIDLEKKKRYDLGFIVDDRETEDAYEKLFEQLFNHGQKEIKVLVSDGHKAIPRAFKNVYGDENDTEHQLCFIHTKRQFLKEAKNNNVKSCLNKIFSFLKICSNKEDGWTFIVNILNQDIKNEWEINNWLNKFSRVYDKLMVFKSFEWDKQKMIYTSNLVESVCAKKKSPVLLLGIPHPLLI